MNITDLTPLQGMIQIPLLYAPMVLNLCEKFGLMDYSQLKQHRMMLQKQWDNASNRFNESQLQKNGQTENKTDDLGVKDVNYWNTQWLDPSFMLNWEVLRWDPVEKSQSLDVEIYADDGQVYRQEVSYEQVEDFDAPIEGIASKFERVCGFLQEAQISYKATFDSIDGVRISEQFEHVGFAYVDYKQLENQINESVHYQLEMHREIEKKLAGQTDKASQELLEWNANRIDHYSLLAQLYVLGNQENRSSLNQRLLDARLVEMQVLDLQIQLANKPYWGRFNINEQSSQCIKDIEYLKNCFDQLIHLKKATCQIERFNQDGYQKMKKQGYKQLEEKIVSYYTDNLSRLFNDIGKESGFEKAADKFSPEQMASLMQMPTQLSNAMVKSLVNQSALNWPKTIFFLNKVIEHNPLGLDELTVANDLQKLQKTHEKWVAANSNLSESFKAMVEKTLLQTSMNALAAVHQKDNKDNGVVHSKESTKALRL